MEKIDLNNSNLPMFTAIYSMDQSNLTYSALSQTHIVTAILPSVVADCSWCDTPCNKCEACAGSRTPSCQQACRNCSNCLRNCWI